MIENQPTQEVIQEEFPGEDPVADPEPIIISEPVFIKISDYQYTLICKVLLHAELDPYNGVIIKIQHAPAPAPAPAPESEYHIYYQSKGQCGLYRYYSANFLKPEEEEEEEEEKGTKKRKISETIDPLRLRIHKGNNYSQSTCIHPILQKFIFDNIHSIPNVEIKNYIDYGIHPVQGVGLMNIITKKTIKDTLYTSDRNSESLFTNPGTNPDCNSSDNFKVFLKDPTAYGKMYNAAFNEFDIIDHREIFSYPYTMLTIFDCTCTVSYILLQRKKDSFIIKFYFLKIEIKPLPESLQTVYTINQYDFFIIKHNQPIYLMPFLIVPCDPDDPHGQHDIHSLGLVNKFYNAGIITTKFMDYANQCSVYEKENNYRDGNYVFIANRFLHIFPLNYIYSQLTREDPPTNHDPYTVAASSSSMPMVDGLGSTQKQRFHKLNQHNSVIPKNKTENKKKKYRKKRTHIRDRESTPILRTRKKYKYTRKSVKNG